jgi:uncharacterized membrane protein
MSNLVVITFDGAEEAARVREANANAALSALKPYEGQVYHSSLPSETEDELRDILSRRV